jgi:hypothetical protein
LFLYVPIDYSTSFQITGELARQEEKIASLDHMIERAMWFCDALYLDYFFFQIITSKK